LLIENEKKSTNTEEEIEQIKNEKINLLKQKQKIYDRYVYVCIYAYLYL
jgi:hypothetical protein